MTGLIELKFDVCVAYREPLDTRWLGPSIRQLGNHVHCVHYSSKRPLSVARRELIEKVDTDWLLFLDDDIQITHRWISSVVPFASEPSVGAIEGRVAYVGLGERFDRDHRSFVEKQGIQVLRTHDRGFTHNTLMRTSVVRDWVPLRSTNCFEDLELTRHIQSKGSLWVRVPAGSYHVKSWPEIIRGGLLAGENYIDNDKLERAAKLAAWSVGIYFTTHPLSLKIYTSLQNSAYLFGLVCKSRYRGAHVS
jgi:glycosyltransferase involved in cell wall biosynthesis